ncbi:hypothetical protein BDV06DRAFT_181999 [Aspergillus oleicola]
MLDHLPVEVLLLVFEHLDGITLMELFQLSPRLNAIILPLLHELYHTRTVVLRPGISQAALGDQYTLKFVKRLVFKADDPAVCYRDFRTEEATINHELSRALAPLEGCLTKNGLVSFRWEVGTCIPDQLLGPKGYLLQHQGSIESLRLDFSKCCKRQTHDQVLDISPFCNIRSFSWRGRGRFDDCVSLMDFLSCNADHLEELELDAPYSLGKNLQKWQDLNGNSNVLGFKVPRLQEGQTETIFPSLKKLSLCRIGFKSAVTEMAYTFQLHQLRSLKLRKYDNISEMLSTIADVSGTIQLVNMDIEVDASNNENIDAFRRFFELSFPSLEDVFLHVDAWDDESTRVHWRSIFAPGRHLKRFVYHRRHETRGESGFKGFSTLPDTAVELDEEMLSLLSGAKLQCVGLCEDPATLMEKLSKPDVPRLEWEILNIRTAPTYLNQRLHNLRHAILTPRLDFEDLNDLLAVFSTRFPSLSFDFASQTRYFMPFELLDFFTFAAWAFGPTGLLKLDLLVYGEVDDVHVPSSNCLYLCRNPATAPLCLPFRQLGTVSGDGDIHDQKMRRKFQAHAELFETMPSSEWEF